MIFRKMNFWIWTRRNARVEWNSGVVEELLLTFRVQIFLALIQSVPCSIITKESGADQHDSRHFLVFCFHTWSQKVQRRQQEAAPAIHASFIWNSEPHPDNAALGHSPSACARFWWLRWRTHVFPGKKSLKQSSLLKDVWDARAS